MDEDFVCVLCRKPITGERRLSTRYCGQKCRNKALDARRREETLKRRNENERILATFDDWLRQFRHELLKRASPEAGGYQAGLWLGQMTYWFPCIPADARYRNTLTRTRSRYDFFTLEPFEPPSVPLVAEYQIRFVQKIPPYPPLPEDGPNWTIRIPFAVRIRRLPFVLKAIPRALR